MNKDELYFIVRTKEVEYDGRNEKIDRDFIKKQVDNFKISYDDFFVLVPSRDINKNVYIQKAPSSNDREFVLETRLVFPEREEDFKHYEKRFSFTDVDLKKAIEIFCDYLEEITPNLSEWIDITEEF